MLHSRLTQRRSQQAVTSMTKIKHGNDLLAIVVLSTQISFDQHFYMREYPVSKRIKLDQQYTFYLLQVYLFHAHACSLQTIFCEQLATSLLATTIGGRTYYVLLKSTIHEQPVRSPSVSPIHAWILLPISKAIFVAGVKCRDSMLHLKQMHNQ